MEGVRILAPHLGIVRACATLGMPRATFYRQNQQKVGEVRPMALPAWALSDAEKEVILGYLHSERFADHSVREVHTTLFDEGVHLASTRTFYRLLQSQEESVERRRQRPARTFMAPVLCARSPNHVWSWDITKLQGPQKGEFYQLYVIIDIFSRLVVGWLLTDHESAVLAEHLFVETFQQQGICRGLLTVHADRGAAMCSILLSSFLQSQGVTRSHSRPRVSNDNPFSESSFKTLKYQHDYPRSFASLEEARGFCRRFYQWYNEAHHHEGIALLTPWQVHSGQAKAVLEARQITLDASYAAHPERYRQPPQIQHLPTEVWINRPTTEILLPISADSIKKDPR